MHSLQNTVQQTLKKNNPQLGSNTDQSGEVWQSYQYATQLVSWWYYWYYSSIDNIIFNEPSGPNF